MVVLCNQVSNLVPHCVPGSRYTCLGSTLEVTAVD